jgi:ABC-type Na+ efflux pump permease subunit
MEKENLQNLLNEKSSLGKDLRLAIDANNGEEISRLKQREKSIDSEVFSAQILALKADIREVEARLALDRENVLQAKETSRQTDSLVVAQISVLREEIQRVNNESLAKLVAVKTSENCANETGGKLMELNRKLAEFVK